MAELEVAGSFYRPKEAEVLLNLYRTVAPGRHPRVMGGALLVYRDSYVLVLSLHADTTEKERTDLQIQFARVGRLVKTPLESLLDTAGYRLLEVTSETAPETLQAFLENPEVIPSG